KIEEHPVTLTPPGIKGNRFRRYWPRRVAPMRPGDTVGVIQPPPNTGNGARCSISVHNAACKDGSSAHVRRWPCHFPNVRRFTPNRFAGPFSDAPTRSARKVPPDPLGSSRESSYVALNTPRRFGVRLLARRASAVSPTPRSNETDGTHGRTQCSWFLNRRG